jgi:DNA-binding response OmpR family regulator
MFTDIVQRDGKILLADSDTASAMRLASALLRQGWPVVSARDALQMQNMARKENPIAIVLSSFLPGGDASVMLKRIRGSAYTVNVPVFVLHRTGGPSKEEVLTAGANEYFEKAEDCAAICEALRRHFDASAIPVQAPILAPASAISSPSRLAALEAAEVLDTAHSRLQDSITRIASNLIGVPVTLLSLVDQDRQFFKSHIGLPDPWRSDRQTPLSHSFCQWVVSGEEELIVEDARQMPALQSNAAVSEIGVISYAGIPVRSQSGHVLGSFCAIDSKPRSWNRAELTNLRNLARMAESTLIVEALTTSAPARFRGILTIMLNAIEILRRNPAALASESNTLLLELIEDQNRTLLNFAPVSGTQQMAVAAS